MFIFWHPELKKDDKGNYPVSIHLLVRRNRDSLPNFTWMSNELRKTFPFANDSDIKRHMTVTMSSHDTTGYCVITLNCNIPTGFYHGWTQFIGTAKVSNCSEYKVVLVNV